MYITHHNPFSRDIITCRLSHEQRRQLQLRMCAGAWSRELWPSPTVVARRSISLWWKKHSRSRGKRSSTRANGTRRRSNTSIPYERTRKRARMCLCACIHGWFIHKSGTSWSTRTPLTWSSWRRVFSFITRAAYYARTPTEIFLVCESLCNSTIK